MLIKSKLAPLVTILLLACVLQSGDANAGEPITVKIFECEHSVERTVKGDATINEINPSCAELEESLASYSTPVPGLRPGVGIYFSAKVEVSAQETLARYYRVKSHYSYYATYVPRKVEGKPNQVVSKWVRYYDPKYWDSAHSWNRAMSEGYLRTENALRMFSELSQDIQFGIEPFHGQSRNPTRVTHGRIWVSFRR